MTYRLQTSPRKRAVMEGRLEYGTHALLGQHLYRKAAPATIPGCQSCGRKRVLYGGVCADCSRAEQREEAGRG